MNINVVTTFNKMVDWGDRGKLTKNDLSKLANAMMRIDNLKNGEKAGIMSAINACGGVRKAQSILTQKLDSQNSGIHDKKRQNINSIFEGVRNVIGEHDAKKLLKEQKLFKEKVRNSQTPLVGYNLTEIGRRNLSKLGVKVPDLPVVHSRDPKVIELRQELNVLTKSLAENNDSRAILRNRLDNLPRNDDKVREKLSYHVLYAVDILEPAVEKLLKEARCLSSDDQEKIMAVLKGVYNSGFEDKPYDLGKLTNGEENLLTAYLINKAKELGTKQFTVLEDVAESSGIAENLKRQKCEIQMDILYKEQSKLEIAIRNCKTELNAAMPGWDKRTEFAERTDLAGLAAYIRLTK